MTSSKWITGLLAVVLVLALAPSGFAQNVQLSVLNSASASEIAGNRHANVTDPNQTQNGSGILVSGSVFLGTGAGNLSTSLLVLRFPGAITSGVTAFTTGSGGTVVNVPSAADGIRITGQTGIFGQPSTVVAITSIDYTNGIITIALQNIAVTAGQSGSFSIVGVRMDLTGATAGTSKSMTTITTTASAGYTAPATMPTLISNITAGGPSLAIGSNGTSTGVATLFTNQTNGSPSDGTASLLITEPSNTAWRSTTQWSTGGSTASITGTQFNVSLSNIPAGMSVALTTNVGTTGLAVTNSLATLSSTATTTLVTVTGSDLAQTDRLGIDFVISGVPTTTPLTANVITATVTLVPTVNSNAAVGPVILGGLNPSSATCGQAGCPVTTGGFPRWDATGNTASLAIGSIISLQTTMLVPFAISSSPYLTSLAISNTSLDNFPAGGATPTSNGTITFDLFQAGVRNSVTTSGANAATIGSGLTASTGALAAGATFQTGMTQLLTAAGLNPFTSWAGYILISANFPNAHGVTYTFTGTNLTASSEIDVIPQPAVTARTQTNESLGF